MKRLLTAIVLTVLLTLGASAEVYSGRSGDSSKWFLDTDSGVLTIQGTGVLNNFNSPNAFERHIGAGDNATWVIEYVGGEESPRVVERYIGGNTENATWVLEYTDYDCVERYIGGNTENATWVLEYTDFYSYERKIGAGPNSVWYLVQGLAPWIPYEYKTVKIPKGITKIDENSAFYCSEFDVDADNPNYVSVDGVLFSKDMTELIRYPVKREDTTYTVPEGVKSINYFAFQDAQNLRRINIPDSVTYIGDFAFAGCINLDTVNLPSKLREIKQFTFYDCYNLWELEIPKYVTQISKNAFWDSEKRQNLEIVLYVCKDSYAKTYAIMNEIGFNIYYDNYDELYIIESITLMNHNYEELPTIPSSGFIAEVNITNLCSVEKDYILIACYNSDNRIVDVGFMYASTLGGQNVSLGTYIKNENGDISKIQAFILSDLKSFKVLAESKAITKQ